MPPSTGGTLFGVAGARAGHYRLAVMTGRRWTFLTNHAQVLYEVWRTPDLTVRDIAARTHITERAAHRILTELVDDGYLVRSRQGRRNHYVVNEERPLRRKGWDATRVAKLLRMLEETMNA